MFDFLFFNHQEGENSLAAAVRGGKNQTAVLAGGEDAAPRGAGLHSSVLIWLLELPGKEAP